jgi:hypothetical protein
MIHKWLCGVKPITRSWLPRSAVIFTPRIIRHDQKSPHCLSIGESRHRPCLDRQYKNVHKTYEKYHDFLGWSKPLTSNVIESFWSIQIIVIVSGVTLCVPATTANTVGINAVLHVKSPRTAVTENYCYQKNVWCSINHDVSYELYNCTICILLHPVLSVYATLLKWVTLTDKGGSSPEQKKFQSGSVWPTLGFLCFVIFRAVALSLVLWQHWLWKYESRFVTLRESEFGEISLWGRFNT